MLFAHCRGIVRIIRVIHRIYEAYTDQPTDQRGKANAGLRPQTNGKSDTASIRHRIRILTVFAWPLGYDSPELDS